MSWGEGSWKDIVSTCFNGELRNGCIWFAGSLFSVDHQTERNQAFLIILKAILKISVYFFFIWKQFHGFKSQFSGDWCFL